MNITITTKNGAEVYGKIKLKMTNVSDRKDIACQVIEFIDQEYYKLIDEEGYDDEEPTDSPGFIPED